MLSTLEASARFTCIFSSTPPTVREFNPYFVAHEVALVILSNAFFSSSSTVKFLQSSHMRFDSSSKNVEITHNEAIAKSSKDESTSHQQDG